MDFARIAFYQKLALGPADSLASGSTDLKLLNMDMLLPVHMSRFVEPELEDNENGVIRTLMNDVIRVLRPSDMNVCAGPYPAPADLQLADAPKSLNAG